MNTLVYSYDGMTWSNNSTYATTIFTTQGRCVTWNGTRFVAGGQGGNTLAYSTNGIVWTGAGTSIFSSVCNAVCYGAGTTAGASAVLGQRFVAGGLGTANTLAYSADGITWTGAGSSVFTQCNGLAWNGRLFVGVGTGTYTVQYSYDGITWAAPTTTGTSIFSTAGYGVCWTGSKFVATGASSTGGNTLISSADGLIWTPAPSATNGSGFTTGYGCASNPRVGAIIVDSQMVLNGGGLNQSNKLDVVTDSYNNNGFQRFTMSVTQHKQ